MKNFKRFAALILFFAVFVCAAFNFTSCVGGGGSGVVRIVIENAPINSDGEILTTEYEVDSETVEGESLVDLFEYLSKTENVAFEMDGTMIGRVGNLTNDYTEGVWIYIYTSVESDKDVSQYAENKEYKGQTLTSSGVGVLDMHYEDGAVIYIGTIKYE